MLSLITNHNNKQHGRTRATAKQSRKALMGATEARHLAEIARVSGMADQRVSARAARRERGAHATQMQMHLLSRRTW